MISHEYPVRVYYEDTDAGGVVYHANYLCYLERARTEWLRTLAFSQATLKKEQSLAFAVVGMTVDFIKPARLDDLLSVQSRIKLAGNASVCFEQEIWREAERLLVAAVKVACVELTAFKPRRLPAALREYLQ